MANPSRRDAPCQKASARSNRIAQSIVPDHGCSPDFCQFLHRPNILCFLPSEGPRPRGFGHSEFGVAIENVSHRGCFTEKILDCFLLKTIPFYWGCSNISDFFNPEGIIKFDNLDDLIYISNQLNDKYYKSKEKVIKENWVEAQKYVDYEQNICNQIENVFKLNNII
jgi:hypothetical protein